jgi:hypothetical protein
MRLWGTKGLFWGLGTDVPTRAWAQTLFCPIIDSVYCISYQQYLYTFISLASTVTTYKCFSVFVKDLSVRAPQIFNVSINDPCNSIKHSSYLLFADNIKICCAISSVTVHIYNQMILTDKTKVTACTRKTCASNYNYKVCTSYSFQQISGRISWF